MVRLGGKRCELWSTKSAPSTVIIATGRISDIWYRCYVSDRYTRQKSFSIVFSNPYPPPPHHFYDWPFLQWFAMCLYCISYLYTSSRSFSHLFADRVHTRITFLFFLTPIYKHCIILLLWRLCKCFCCNKVYYLYIIIYAYS